MLWYYPPTTPLPGKGGGFEFLKSLIPHPWGARKSRSFCSRSKVNFMNCQKPLTFQVKSDQIPPGTPRRGVVALNIDRCITVDIFISATPTCKVFYCLLCGSVWLRTHPLLFILLNISCTLSFFIHHDGFSLDINKTNYMDILQWVLINIVEKSPVNCMLL